MSIAAVLAARVAEHAPASVLEQENVLQELLQQYVLCSLATTTFFSQAMFHGGTCLRLMHGMNRFSEDLDFLLKKPDPLFAWAVYLPAVERECQTEGLTFETNDQSTRASAVRKALLKIDALDTLLGAGLPFAHRARRKFRIKLEVDTNPPPGSSFDTRYLTFPRLAALTTQSLPSSFGTKAHALLCRSYTKGRDWYDFQWYAAKGVAVDLNVLAGALRQQGAWSGRRIAVTPPWFATQMARRIRQLDWPVVRRDVQRFLPLREQRSLELWNQACFLQHLERVMAALQRADTAG